MHADIKGALAQINTSWSAFEHKGERMTKDQVKKVLEYGLKKGYKTTAEFSDDEIDELLKIEPLNERQEYIINLVYNAGGSIHRNRNASLKTYYELTKIGYLTSDYLLNGSIAFDITEKGYQYIQNQKQ